MAKRRLAHSTRGFMRRIQIAHRDSIFVVTEGKNSDRWLYSGTLSKSDVLDEVGIQYYPVESVAPGAASGKNTVLKVFQRLRSAGKLATRNSSGGKFAVFFVDADHDHITARKYRSAHLIYTQLPDAEAHILAECDLVEVVANVASLPKDEAEATVTAFGPWEHDLAIGWRDWMILCCAGNLMNLQNCPAPGTPPKKTDGKMGPSAANRASGAAKFSSVAAHFT